MQSIVEVLHLGRVGLPAVEPGDEHADGRLGARLARRILYHLLDELEG